MEPTRRTFLKTASIVGATALLPPSLSASPKVRFNTIPSTSESIHPIGMGTWITFNVGRSPALIEARAKVLKTFFDLGGQMIDSSPMYGSAEQVLGKTFELAPPPSRMFTATKTWTSSGAEGKQQFVDSMSLWQRPSFDLLQIHNLVGWQTHLPILQELKRQNLIRFIGVTTSHGRRHEELRTIIESQDIDFVQLTYNIRHREVEQYLLPAAKERGIAVIANRPLDGGNLMDDFESKPLPMWAKELGINNWAQYFLRFIISHPAITTAIPATSKVAHMKENMGAANPIPLPNTKQRQAMINYLRGI